MRRCPFTQRPPFEPISPTQATLFALLGTPPADKRWVLFPLGHLPPIDETARETLDWLDRDLGPVGRGDSRLEILEN